MADKNEELVKKELLMILKLNSKLNYQRKEEIKKMHAAIAERKMFTTPLGLKYMKRLEQIGKGEEILKKCILCAGDLDNHSLICTKCIKKFHALQFQEKDREPVGEKKDRQRQPSGTAGQLSGTKNNSDAVSPDKEEKTDKDGQEKSLKESLRKKGFILGIFIVALWIINEVIGLGNLFAFCTIVTLCVLIYKCVKKQGKRNTIIALAVFFLLAGLFGDTGSGKSNDVADMIGKTEEQVWKEWGEPDKGGGINSVGEYDAGYNYAVMAIHNGKISYVDLDEANDKTLMGISIGDSEDEVDRIMKKADADFVGRDSITGTKIYQTDEGITIKVDFRAGIVSLISADSFSY